MLTDESVVKVLEQSFSELCTSDKAEIATHLENPINVLEFYILHKDQIETYYQLKSEMKITKETAESRLKEIERLNSMIKNQSVNIVNLTDEKQKLMDKLNQLNEAVRKLRFVRIDY